MINCVSPMPVIILSAMADSGHFRSRGRRLRGGAEPTRTSSSARPPYREGLLDRPGHALLEVTGGVDVLRSPDHAHRRRGSTLVPLVDVPAEGGDQTPARGVVHLAGPWWILVSEQRSGRLREPGAHPLARST